MSSAEPSTYAPVYEHRYGFDLLDQLHNFFPELLYDARMFAQHELIQWVRHRIRTLFPDIYVREQQQYRLYHSASRMESYTAWRRRTAAPVETTTVPLRPVAAVSRPTTTTAAPSALATNIWSQLLSAPLLDMSYTTSSLSDPITIAMLNGLLGLRGGEGEDVVVAPTEEQIRAGSTVVEHTSVPTDVACAICQDRDTAQQWRRLHCDHYFHKRCVDEWLHRNVRCPVCRTDIRDASDDDGDDEEETAEEE